MAEELQRSRRPRVEILDGRGGNGPPHRLELIKIWMGTGEKSFTDLHLSVQQAVRSWIDGHMLGADWYEFAQRRLKSCMRKAHQERCYVPAEGTSKVAWGQCAGGKTFCIRRQTEHDPNLCLFPLHTGERGDASVNEVTFWRMTGRKTTPPGFYKKKLYSQIGIL
ncbi:hypothetical protein E8E12_004370 [Didymella heteroderae]|uniref:Uncharacterized protein n=1 Tax=Didymella heteroderae TaxID=1769908 RepID=A0A9P4WYD0_9PLEO|nr:hypothetical protein E8E12_004370 [Didymella heteroderae]